MSYALFPIIPPACKLPIIVHEIGYEDNQPHVFRREGFSMHQLFVCKSGEGTLKVDDNTFIIQKGSFFNLMPNIPHEYYGNTEQWEVVWIAFSGHQIDNVMAELKFNKTKVGMINNFDKIQALINKIFVTLRSEDEASKMIASGILYEILIELYTNLFNKNGFDNPNGNAIINEVKRYIDNHYNQDITIEELSNLVDVTPQYLCKQFKRYVNLRPFQYIALKRIQNAKKMLSNDTLSINDIAHLVGYHDCSYFCSIFKKYEMISPSEFRSLRLK